MATVAYARTGTAKGRMNIGVVLEDGVVRYSVRDGVYYNIGSPTKGAELDDECLLVIQRDDEEYRSMHKALTLLAASDKNSRMLYRKLREGGISGEVASETVRECIRLGYLDERRQLAVAILREANTFLRGPHLIRRKLASKGYRQQDIDGVMDELTESGEVDFSRNLLRLIEKHGADTEEERRSLAYKQGYSSDNFDF